MKTLRTNTLATSPTQALLRRCALGALLTVTVTACGSTVQLQGQLAPADSQGLGTSAGDSNSSTGQMPAGQAGSPGQSPIATGSTSQVPSGQLPTAVGATGSTTGASGSTTGNPGSSAAVASGKGFTAKQVFLGFNTLNDSNASGADYGLSSIGYGDMKANAEAFLADINRHGGVLGRKLVGVYHDEKSADYVANPVQNAQQTCAALTQDGRVAVAIINNQLGDDHKNFYQCMSQSKTPLLTQGAYALTRRSLATVSPYLHLNLAAAWDNLSPTWVSRLHAMGYFGGWNTATAAPGPGVAQVGILHVDTAAGKAGGDALEAALKKKGISVLANNGYRDPAASGTAAAVQDGSSQAFVLKARGVTHVFLDFPGAIPFFSQAASSQNYYPRFAVNSGLLPQFAQKNAPAKSLHGAMGVGWAPVADVGNVGNSPTATYCLNVLRAANIRPTANDNSLITALLMCDQIRLFVAAAKAGGGLDAARINAGLNAVGNSHSLASSFKGAFSASRIDNVGAVRDIEFKQNCGCFAYRSNQLYDVN